MKSWVLEHFHVRNDFLWIKNGYYYTNIKPKWIINTKYSNKALENNKVVNWFFFKKKLNFYFKLYSYKLLLGKF